MNVTNWNPYEAFTQLFIGRKGAVRVAFFLQELYMRLSALSMFG